jgi:hypothetical protein
VASLPQNYPVLISQLQFDDDVYHPAADYIELKLRLQQLFDEQSAG